MLSAVIFTPTVCKLTYKTFLLKLLLEMVIGHSKRIQAQHKNDDCKYALQA